MAGDFVMVQVATPRKPEVLRLATMLKIEPAHAFGLCVMAWMWFDEQTEDGRAIGATDEMLDAVVCRAGFSNALREVGWLQVREGSLVVPNFDRLMGESAKKRAKNTVRQRQSRLEQSVANLSRKKRDKSATKEEKRIEEKRTEEKISEEEPALPPILDNEEFKKALSSWLAYKKKAHRFTYEPEGLAAMISLAANRATEHGLPAVVLAMQKAMANSWKGWDQDSAFGVKPATYMQRPKKDYTL